MKSGKPLWGPRVQPWEGYIREKKTNGKEGEGKKIKIHV